MNRQEKFHEIKEQFISQWGVLGGQWGINRTMAQIHALLMVSAEPLSTDDIMEQLQISRGNAHGNLKDLVQWRLVRSILKKGERKDYFEAEKDVWKILRMVVRGRKSREIDPTLEVLKSCSDKVSKLNGKDAEAFHKQITELYRFVTLAAGLMDRVANSENSLIFTMIIKILEGKQAKKTS